jgi:hypothetical protein
VSGLEKVEPLELAVHPVEHGSLSYWKPSALAPTARRRVLRRFAQTVTPARMFLFEQHADRKLYEPLDVDSTAHDLGVMLESAVEPIVDLEVVKNLEFSE